MTGWFYTVDRKAQGPISKQELCNLFSQGRLGPDTLLWAEGMAQWQKASESALFAAPPPPPRPAPPSLSQGRPTPAPSPFLAANFSVSPSRADTGFGQTGIAQAGEGLRVGEILRQSFSILRARVGFWLLTGLIGFLVLLPFAYIFNQDGINIVKGVVESFLSVVLTYAAFQTYCGRDFRLVDAFQKGSERFLPIIGISLLVSPPLIAGIIVILVTGRMLGTIVGGSLYFAFVVFTIMALMRLSVCVAVCVAEKAGPIVSIRRSLQLTDGSSWKIFGLTLIVVGPFILTVVLIVGAAIVATGSIEAAKGTIDILALITLPIQWLYSAFAVITTTNTYAALRRNHEGFTTNDIAQVFD